MTRSEAGKLGAKKAFKTQREQRNKRRAEYSKNPTRCIECKKEIEYLERNNKKFCNNSCSATFYNRQRVRKMNECLFCTKSCKEKYCSIKCWGELKRQKYIADWKSGTINGGTINGVTPAIKRYLIGKYGNWCSLCKWCKTNPITKKVPIEVDHIDGDHDHNTEENLRLLCPNCHSLTPTYKALNSGKGREHRRLAHGNTLSR